MHRHSGRGVALDLELDLYRGDARWVKPICAYRYQHPPALLKTLNREGLSPIEVNLNHVDFAVPETVGSQLSGRVGIEHGRLQVGPTKLDQPLHRRFCRLPAGSSVGQKGDAVRPGLALDAWPGRNRGLDHFQPPQHGGIKNSRPRPVVEQDLGDLTPAGVGRCTVRALPIAKTPVLRRPRERRPRVHQLDHLVQVEAAHPGNLPNLVLRLTGKGLRNRFNCGRRHRDPFGGNGVTGTKHCRQTDRRKDSNEIAPSQNATLANTTGNDIETLSLHVSSVRPRSQHVSVG